MKPLRFLLGAATLALAAQPSFAQQSSENPGATADITGRWSFLSDPTYPGCSLSGEVFISSTPDENRFTCTVVANDVCPGVWSYRAEETCVAERDGDQLTIASRVLQVKPSTGNYLPDDFAVTIISGSRMTGDLVSALVTDVEFFRGDTPIG